MKKFTALFLALALALSLFGCSSGSTASSPSASAGAAPAKVTGQKWIDSDVQGNVTADTATDPTDDFALYVNKDWDVAFNADDNDGESIIPIQENKIAGLVTELIKAGADTSHDGKLVSTLYKDTIDVAARNTAGVNPVKKYVKAIQNIRSMAELSAFISDPGNQLIVSPLMDVESLSDFKDNTKNVLYLLPSALSLGDSAEYASITDAGKRTKEAAVTMFAAFMAKFGVSKYDAQQAYETMSALETQLAQCEVSKAGTQHYLMSEDSYNVDNIKALSAKCKNFPLTAVLKQYTDAGISSFNNCQPKWLAKQDELYTADNLEAWKSMLLYSLMLQNVSDLDEDCLKLYTDYNNTIGGTSDKPDIEGYAYVNCNKRLNWAVGKMYCDKYITEDTKNDIKDMISEIIAVYRKRLANCDWLSEATRNKAVEKLDAIKVHAVYPDDWTPYEYTGLDFPANGGVFADLQAINAYERAKKIKNVVTPPTGDIWQAEPQAADACYIPTDNSINITAGVLGDAFYDPKASESTNLGGIGEVIGHEITHAFDSSGSTFDKDGRLNNWWTDADRAAFNKKTEKVAAYYASFEPLAGYKVDGSMTLGETVGDLGSYSCLMELAKTKPDFNYKEFFTNTAKMFRMQQSEIAEQVWIKTNPHPPYYLRVNTNLSMLQEFQDTYGVKKGDNMYVAPADRLSVW